MGLTKIAHSPSTGLTSQRAPLLGSTPRPLVASSTTPIFSRIAMVIVVFRISTIPPRTSLTTEKARRMLSYVVSAAAAAMVRTIARLTAISRVVEWFTVAPFAFIGS